MYVEKFNLVVTAARESIGHYGERENEFLPCLLPSLIRSNLYVGSLFPFPCSSLSTWVKILS